MVFRFSDSVWTWFSIFVFIAFVVCCSNTYAQGRVNSSQAWELDSPATNITKPFALEPEILPGPFTLGATVTLNKLAGTAASVWIGDNLNFGFDSRSETFFAEGPAIGKTRLLAKNSELLRPEVPFSISIKRVASGKVEFAIDGYTIFETNLSGAVGQVRFRPMRNIMSVKSVSIEGNLKLREEGIYPESIAIPLLNDGAAQTFMRLRLKTSSKRKLQKVSFDLNGTDVLHDLEEISIVTKENSSDCIAMIADPSLENREAKLDREMPPGLHEFVIRCKVRENAHLLNRVRIAIESVTFDDGTQWKAESDKFCHRIACCIHKKMQHDCHTFRIPAIARTNNGTLLAVYDMRYNSSRDLQEHIDIGLSRSTDCGQTWSAPQPIMDMGEYGGKPQKENGCSDPGILVDPVTGEIFVSAVWTYGKPNTHQWVGKGSEPGLEIGTTAQFMVVRSTDDGRTWSEPENWTRQLKKEEWWLFAPAPGNGIALKNGTLVMPTQGRDRNGLPFSNVTYSLDHGKTWKVSNPARTNTTE